MSTPTTPAEAASGSTPVAAEGFKGPAPESPGRPDRTEGPEGTDPRDRLVAVRSEVAKAVIGQEAAVTGLVITMLAGGHVLLEGVPGVAKTLLVRSLAQAMNAHTKRIQFTPDLMPGDVTGSLIYDARSSAFSFREGPVFTNLLLADEINRTPPKTQAALLEAMEEHQVSIDGEPRSLPDPFMVIATQNPVEYEGTYPLPEAQLDRFLLKLVLPLPERAQEIEVLSRHATGFPWPIPTTWRWRAPRCARSEPLRRSWPTSWTWCGPHVYRHRYRWESRPAAPPHCSPPRGHGPGCRDAAS